MPIDGWRVTGDTQAWHGRSVRQHLAARRNGSGSRAASGMDAGAVAGDGYWCACGWRALREGGGAGRVRAAGMLMVRRMLITRRESVGRARARHGYGYG